jgi:hypothetical protein
MGDTPINIPPNNWTQYITNTIGTAVKATSDFQIGTDGGGVTNPAPNCTQPLLFTANYRCGNDSKTLTKNISNAWGKSIQLNCSTAFKKCAGSKLTLDDTGVLTLTDKDGNKTWQSNKPAGFDSNNPPLALPQYASASTNPAAGQHSQNNYLKSGEFLNVGEWIGSPSGMFRLEMVELNPIAGTPAEIAALASATLTTAKNAASDNSKWTQVAIEGGTFMVTTDNTVLRYGLDSSWTTPQLFNKGTTVTANNATFTNPSPGADKVLQQFTSSGTRKTLRVVYNVLGCTDALTAPTSVSPLNANSATVYSIPSINTQNVGKTGYVNEFGQLQTYVDPSLTAYPAESEFKNVGNYGVIGGDLGLATPAPKGMSDCQLACADQQCSAFVYESVGKTCQLKGPAVLTTGQRFINNNYEYYVRTKGLSTTVDASCPQTVETRDASEWAQLNTVRGNDMTASSVCGLKKFTQAERNANDATLAAVDNNFSGIGKLIDSLTLKYGKLKRYLFNTKDKLDDSLIELQKSKQGLADWSGEQLEQLDAMNEDRELNMKSEYLQHNMYIYIVVGILAIIAIIGIVKFVLRFISGAAPSGPSASAPTAPTAPTAPSAAPSAAAT